MHVKAIAITERERGTDEAPDGRVVQGNMSGRGRAGRAGGETARPRACWTGLRAWNLRACRGEISARPGSLWPARGRASPGPPG